MLSSEMTHGTHQIAGPHFTHTMSNCGGVDAEAYTTTDECRHTHCYCCTMTVDFIDVWLDFFEDGPLIKCLFETGIIPESCKLLVLAWQY